MARSGEAFWWSLFSAGGVVAGMFVPVLVLLTGFLLPGLPDGGYAALRGALEPWPAKIVIVGVVALSLFHCAHRIRHTSLDLGLRPLRALVALVCYGGALAGTVAAALAVAGV